MFVHSSIPLTRKPDGTPYPINYQTSLSFSIKETSIFIYNKQEPIARRSEIIFHTVLFINTCLGLLAMFFSLTHTLDHTNDKIIFEEMCSS